MSRNFELFDPSQETSLWSCLHDGDLTSVSFDEATRLANLDIRLGFPDPAGKGMVFTQKTTFTIHAVTVFLVAVWKRRESNKAPARSGSYVSLGMPELQDLLRSDSLSIMDASGCFPAGQCAVRFEGYFGPQGDPFELYVEGEQLGVTVAGQRSSVHELLELGKSGWDALSDRA